MPNFLASLLVLVSSFILPTHPIVNPPILPILPIEIDRGTEVSTLVKHEPTLTPIPSEGKIPAYNNKSEKEMPTNLPQNAIDHSPSLDSLPTDYVEPTKEPKPIVIPPHITITPYPEPVEFVGSLGIYGDQRLELPSDIKPDNPKPGEQIYPSGIGTASEGQASPGHKN